MRAPARAASGAQPSSRSSSPITRAAAGITRTTCSACSCSSCGCGGTSMHRDAPPLRILMVLESNFTKRGGGGAESQLRTIALALKRAGQRVVIVTPLSANGPQTTAERCYGVPVARVTHPRIKLVGARIMNLQFAAFLVQNRNRWDAWHVHIGHNMGALTCLIGAILGKPVVVKI